MRWLQRLFQPIIGPNVKAVASALVSQPGWTTRVAICGPIVWEFADYKIYTRSFVRKKISLLVSGSFVEMTEDEIDYLLSAMARCKSTPKPDPYFPAT